MQVVALHDEVAAVRFAARQLRHRLQQAERHVLVMFDDGFLAVQFSVGMACSEFLNGAYRVARLVLFGVCREGNPLFLLRRPSRESSANLCYGYA